MSYLNNNNYQSLKTECKAKDYVYKFSNDIDLFTGTGGSILDYG